MHKNKKCSIINIVFESSEEEEKNIFNAKRVNGWCKLTFGIFDSTAEANIQVFDFFDKVIANNNPDIITGDFNVEDIMSLMNITNNNYIRTVEGKN